MAQVIDFNIAANPSGLNMRTELNGIIEAILTQNSGTDEPLNPFSGMEWVDKSDVNFYYIKKRNLTNDGWEVIYVYDVLNNKITPFGEIAYTIETVNDFASIPTIYKTAIVKDLNRGGTFIWSATGTANGGTVFAGATGYWNRQYVGSADVKWFGAVGDGITNDTVSIEMALNFGGELDGSGGIYKLMEAINLTSSNTSVSNCTFDMSDIPDFVVGSWDYIINYTGTQNGNVYLTSDLLEGSYTVQLTSTDGLLADDYIYVSSNAIFETTQSVVLGQIAKIKTVDSSTQVTLYNDILYDFTTSDVAKISKLNTLKNITFDNCKFIGANANQQSALNFHICENVTVTNCKFEFCDYVACRVSRTINFTADSCYVRHARAVGTSYGFAIANASYSAKIQNSYGEDLRHFVTVGDNDGVSLFVNVQGNHVSACQDAGIDAHAACDFMTINGNTIEGSSFDSGQLDGIIFQGLNCIITNNTVVNARRYSIFHQKLPDIGKGSCVISNNIIEANRTADGSCIYVSSESASNTNLDSVVINGNILGRVIYQGIRVTATSSNISNVNISNNTMEGIASLYGVLVQQRTTYTIDNVVVSGNIIKSSGASVVYFLGETLGNFKNVLSFGNKLYGGSSYSNRLLNVTNAKLYGNTYENSVRKYYVITSTGISLDHEDSNSINVTNATYTVLEQDKDIIVNRNSIVTITLPDAAVYKNRVLNIKTVQSYAVDSASSNVVPINNTVAGTSILPGASGAWAVLKSDGLNWVVVQKG